MLSQELHHCEMLYVTWVFRYSLCLGVKFHTEIKAVTSSKGPTQFGGGGSFSVIQWNPAPPQPRNESTEEASLLGFLK
jgi:hypothetical protein